MLPAIRIRESGNLSETHQLIYKSLQTQPSKRMPSTLVNFSYPIENYLKIVFIPMAVLNAPYTALVALTISIMALLRVCKTPQLSREYAQRVLLNNHGQNLMYIGLGAVGQVNFLFYAPLIVFFGFTLMEFVNQKYSGTALAPKYMPFVNSVRNQKFYVMEGRAKVEMAYFAYLVFTLPLDFLNRLLRVALLGQYLLLKYKISPESKSAASQVHLFLDQKTKLFGPLNSLYNKAVKHLHDFANAEPRQQQ